MMRRDQGSVPGTWRGTPGASSGSVLAPAANGRLRVAGWTPTVANLLVLVALEIGAYVTLRYVFRTAHGG